MRHPYIIAISIGTLLGIFALFSHGFILGLGHNAWEVPGWPLQRAFERPELLPLIYQALLLRTCDLFIQQGVTYLAVPALLACGLWKLTEVSENNSVLQCFTRSLWAFLVLMLLTAFFGSLAAAFCSDNSIQNWQEQIFNAWFSAISLPLYMSGLLGLISGVAFFVQLLLVGIESSDWSPAARDS